MPGIRHELTVEIFQNEPLLVLMLLRRAGVSIRLGPDVTPVLADSNLSDRDPEEIKSMFSDNVFVYRDGGKKAVAVVAEVQTGSPKHSRTLKWPAYAANARARHDCDTYLLVFATSHPAARDSAKAIRMGHPGWVLTPLITGIGRTPGLPEAGGAYAAELTLLRIATGDLRLDTHEARMFALAAVKQAAPERLSRYTRYLKRLAPPAARRPLEDLMKTMWRDDFVDGLLDQGALTDARAKLLRLLEKRQFAVSEKIREGVEQCADMSTIDTWFDRAIDATVIEEVFAD